MSSAISKICACIITVVSLLGLASDSVAIPRFLSHWTFERLELDAELREQLHDIFSDPEGIDFESSEFRTQIEGILALDHSARELGADATNFPGQRAFFESNQWVRPSPQSLAAMRLVHPPYESSAGQVSPDGSAAFVLQWVRLSLLEEMKRESRPFRYGLPFLLVIAHELGMSNELDENVRADYVEALTHTLNENLVPLIEAASDVETQKNALGGRARFATCHRKQDDRRIGTVLSAGSE